MSCQIIFFKETVFIIDCTNGLGHSQLVVWSVGMDGLLTDDTERRREK